MFYTGSHWGSCTQRDKGKQDLSGFANSEVRPTANMNFFFKDLVHTEQAWPAWMDTVGLDEGDAEDVNGELVNNYYFTFSVWHSSVTVVLTILVCHFYNYLQVHTSSRYANTY